MKMTKNQMSVNELLDSRKEKNYLNLGKILRNCKVVVITFLLGKDLLALQLTQKTAIGGVL